MYIYIIYMYTLNNHQVCFSLLNWFSSNILIPLSSSNLRRGSSSKLHLKNTNSQMIRADFSVDVHEIFDG